ncbi:MAG: carbohydrate ABC transporter permease [Eubacteriales bacterium]|nr:carbohydrate ABC transporter permease [Eubacteriales bacterium]
MKRKMKASWKPVDVLILVILIFLAIIFLFPTFYAFMSALKTNGEILKDSMALPSRLNFDNFIYLFQETEFPRALMNSTILTVVSMMLIIIVVPMAAYGIERKQSRATKAIYSIFIAGMMIPFQVYMVPLFKQLKVLGLYGTLIGPVVIYVAGAGCFGTLLYCSFIRGVPKELEEAAAIDGCGRFRIFWQIVFPLLKPCTSSLIIINGLGIWNDYLMPSLVLNSDTGATINVEIFSFVDQFTSRWDVVFAGTVCGMLPILVIFLCLQKYFVKGVAAGAVKG